VSQPDPGKQPPDVQRILSYPHARHAAIQEIGTGEAVPLKVFSFVTTDKPEQVLKYYSEYLLSNGWNMDKAPTPSPDTTYFSWQNGARFSVHTLDITIIQGSSNETAVTLKLATYLPE
jgi:hypothetical protein